MTNELLGAKASYFSFNFFWTSLADFKNSIEIVLIESVARFKDSCQNRPTYFKDECQKLLKSFDKIIDMDEGEQIIKKSKIEYQEFFDVNSISEYMLDLIFKQ